MEPLIIPEGQSTPNIVLDKTKGKIEFTGNSLPEDVVGFYAPVYKWIENYVGNPNPNTEIHIKLSYFNSSSSKAILDILTILEALVLQNHSVEVIWHYLDLDEDMLSTGQEFASMLNMPFQFVPFYLS